ncbi:response regulator [Polaromonas sp.]|uniref:response regulator n=1 Tax=Polaromonas sp. TaxID=1869339 RepID=UPI002FC7D1D4
MRTRSTPSSSSPAKILIVEDSLTQAQRLRHILEESGYEVSVASDGRIALEMAPQFRPAAIISDIVMPEVDGYELTRRIKEDPALRGIPVILVTAMSDPQDVIRGLECGAENFVLKPYDERYLLSRVQYVLVNHELRKAQDASMGVEIHFDGQRHYITADRLQILNLLLSTYAAVAQRNKELSESQEALEQRSAQVLSANRFLDSIIENIPDAVIMKDAAELRFVRINRAGEELMGYTREELLGKTEHDFFPKEEADAFTAKDRETLAHGRVENIPEEPIHTRNKGLRVLHTKKVPVFDEYGQASHVLGISEDVTEQRKMEREIRRLNAALGEWASHLEASNKELESFSYSVSHDLRSPLIVIDGYTNMLEKVCADRLDEKGARYFSLIHKNIRRMGTLIDDLLAFSKLSRQPVAKGEVDMNQLVRKVIEETLQKQPNGNAPKIEVGALPAALADPGLLHQVWTNLVSNAIKYSSKTPNPVIEVNGRTEGMENVYRIRDNGVGFSMDHYDQLFEVFQRLHHASDFDGTGVGLAIVHRVVTRHGGRVWAQGKVNEGAEFFFALPAAMS